MKALTIWLQQLISGMMFRNSPFRNQLTYKTGRKLDTYLMNPLTLLGLALNSLITGLQKSIKLQMVSEYTSQQEIQLEFFALE
jgi:hypothetical protein